jgi:hypothetical protein
MCAAAAKRGCSGPGRALEGEFAALPPDPTGRPGTYHLVEWENPRNGGEYRAPYYYYST